MKTPKFRNLQLKSSMKWIWIKESDFSETTSTTIKQVFKTSTIDGLQFPNFKKTSKNPSLKTAWLGSPREAWWLYLPLCRSVSHACTLELLCHSVSVLLRDISQSFISFAHAPCFTPTSHRCNGSSSRIIHIHWGTSSTAAMWSWQPSSHWWYSSTSVMQSIRSALTGNLSLMLLDTAFLISWLLAYSVSKCVLFKK